MKKLLIIGIVGVLLVLWGLVPVEAKSKEEIYQEKLTQLKPKDTKGHYVLGLWCVRNKLFEQAEIQFQKVIELKPSHSGARKRLGYVKIKKQWILPEEITAQGWIKHKGKWITEKEKVRLEAVKKLGTYKNVLDKPGADKENLPWDKAREKETDHFIVITNLSVDALNDICFLMEFAYLTWLDYFGFSEPKEKLKVLVMKNRVEFEKICSDLSGYPPSAGTSGRFVPKVLPSNKLREDLILVYYDFAEKLPKLLLFHEGTHYALRLVARACGLTHPPIWLNEGLAVNFESCKVEDKKLVTNFIIPGRLSSIKTALNNNTYIKLKEFINRPKTEYDFDICYPEGWGLVYFLVNGKGGKYKQGFQAYIEAWKGKKINVKKGYCIQDKAAHIKVFEECMGVPIDQLEKEWKEYILSLKEDKPK